MPVCSSSAIYSSTQSVVQVRGPQVLHKACLALWCPRGAGTEVMSAGAHLRVPQHVAGRLSPALGCEQHLLQTEQHLGLLCCLGFTARLSVSWGEQYNPKSSC